MRIEGAIRVRALGLCAGERRGVNVTLQGGLGYVKFVAKCRFCIIPYIIEDVENAI